jgi:hypothetical protein
MEMAERPEHVALGGELRLTMGGVEVTLPALTIAQSERWQEMMGREMLGLDEVGPDPDLSAIFDRLADLSGITVVGLVDLYAQLGACPAACSLRHLPPGEDHRHEDAIGGPEVIRERMTQVELYEALRLMVRTEFPFLQDDRITTAALMLASAAVLFVQRSTTSGHSPPGDSTPEDSGTASPSSSSAGSGEPARSASAATSKKG